MAFPCCPCCLQRFWFTRGEIGEQSVALGNSLSEILLAFSGNELAEISIWYNGTHTRHTFFPFIKT